MVHSLPDQGATPTGQLTKPVSATMPFSQRARQPGRPAAFDRPQKRVVVLGIRRWSPGHDVPSVAGVTDLAVTETWKHRGSLIGDQVRETGDWKDVLDPSTGEAFAAVHAATVDDCLDAVEAAAAAAPAWAKTTPRERAD